MKNWEPTEEVNVRSGPGTEFEIWDTLELGHIVTEIDTTNWCPIPMEDGSIGWVSRTLLKETLATPPIVVPKETLTVLFQSDLTNLFGLPKDGASYMKTISLVEFASQMSHVTDFEGNPWAYKIYCHKLMEVPLKKAFGFLCTRGSIMELKTYDGCFNIRRMTGGDSYSVHSWGLAVDFNASRNPYGGEVTFSDAFIKCFADAGFESGSLWHTPDGMHFQLPWTQDWRNSDNELKPTL